MEKVGKLSKMQIELIKMFNYELDDSQLNDIRDLLSDYFAKKTTEEMDNFIKQNNIGDDDIEEWSSEHMRSR